MFSGKGKESESKKGKFKGRSLKKYGVDLLKEAHKLNPVIGRDEDIKRVIQILCKGTINNVMLIGEPGVGKAAIVEGLVHRIWRGDVPPQLQEVCIFSVNIGLLLAGSKPRVGFEARLRDILEEIEVSDGNVILFIDEIDMLIGVGNSRVERETDAFNYFKSMLAGGQLRCIGATTVEEHQKFIKGNSAFARRFQFVSIAEPSLPIAVDILRGLKEKYEILHGVRIDDQALQKAVELSATCIKGTCLPFKAIDVVDEACVLVSAEFNAHSDEIENSEKERIRLEIEIYKLKKKKGSDSKTHLDKAKNDLVAVNDKLRVPSMKVEKLNEVRHLRQERSRLFCSIKEAERKGDWERIIDLTETLLPQMDIKIEGLENVPGFYSTVLPDHIAKVVSQMTGIPVTRLGESEKEMLDQLADRLRERVLGQDEAVDAVASAVKRSRARIVSKRRPRASLFFLGPTGVGKTQLAMSLAEQLSDSSDENILIRIDMSEYVEKHSIARLIGAPPGYVGFDHGGQLTGAVKRRPYSVVLFDEVEKANDIVLNILLQILCGGRLTDGKGNTVDFSHTTIITTSNVGGDEFMDVITGRKTLEEAREGAKKKLEEHFKPEILGRFNEIIFFNPLSTNSLRGIIKIQLEDIANNAVGCRVESTEVALDYILSENLNLRYGARQVETWLNIHVENRLIDLKLIGILNSNSIARIDMEGGALTFNVVEIEIQQI